MKSKEQKRLEAVERLEREPRCRVVVEAHRAEIWARRKAAAADIRARFKVLDRRELGAVEQRTKDG